MLASGTTTLEMAILLETEPELKPWAWYGGALNQYHTAFLLLMEVFTHPYRAGADRMWTCLDYVFECDPAEPRASKGKKILSELHQKTAIYHSLRGMRAPVGMDKYVGARVTDKPVDRSGSPVAYRKGKSSVSSADGTAPPLAEGEAAEFVGKVPVPQAPQVPEVPNGVQFAGVSNGESLWALPETRKSPGSGSEPAVSPGVVAEKQDDLMADIDWVSSLLRVVCLCFRLDVLLTMHSVL